MEAFVSHRFGVHSFVGCQGFMLVSLPSPCFDLSAQTPSVSVPSLHYDFIVYYVSLTHIHAIHPYLFGPRACMIMYASYVLICMCWPILFSCPTYMPPSMLDVFTFRILINGVSYIALNILIQLCLASSFGLVSSSLPFSWMTNPMLAYCFLQAKVIVAPLWLCSLPLCPIYCHIFIIPSFLLYIHCLV